MITSRVAGINNDVNVRRERSRDRISGAISAFPSITFRITALLITVTMRKS